MKGHAWLWPVLVALAASAAACTSILGDFQPPGSTGQGGGETTSQSSSRASSASAGGGGAGGAPQCKKDNECMDPVQACLLPFCDGGVCATKPVKKGTASPKQVPGDCMKIICDANGAQHTIVDTTNSDDGKECTTDSCDADGTPHHVVMNGAHCGNGGTMVCNMLGDCVACVAPDMCPGEGACVNYVCQTPSCTDGVKNQNETDVDCGGSCPGCGNGLKCVIAGDCASALCQGGKCRPATCDDGMLDMGETDVDCGGMFCLPCGVGKKCMDGGDCSTGVCQGGTCRVATCGDGMEDGTETDTDCGGLACQHCPAGSTCLVDTDCTSGMCAGTPLVCQ